jgi:NADH:ubiquinone oxidoreductase subunit 4 (subunit M)
MISALLLIPLLGVLLILPLNEIKENSKNLMKQLALGVSLINLILSIVV